MFDAAHFWEKLKEHHSGGWSTLEELARSARLSAGTARWAIDYAKRHGLVEIGFQGSVTLYRPSRDFRAVGA